ncbi:hypothetical protein EDD76_11213 [Kineothrix alysoides]|uniref:Butirosin biosynthesis protein H-like n=1 Tax=Kineothrix alysoides TaxID=1469948 RepID=A0A4R1QQS5_9FIRM|nr:hypothetical protein [Kineothrix alysoides]TCL56186.1 hypothetical protein EDD76_11213 [Kineothrix alysoides]
MYSITSHLNCLQFCLYNICKKYYVADYLMFCNSWCFSHDNTKNISQSLSIPLRDYENVYLKEYQGLSTEIISFDSSKMESVIQLVSNKDSVEIDVIIHIDSFECPWHKGYRKLSIPHFIQVKDINYKQKKIICDDPYFNMFQIELPFEYFLSGCKTIRVLRHNPTDSKISSDVILNHIKERTNIKQITEDIVSFAQRLSEVKTTYELFDYRDDVFFCSNVRNLKFIADSRYGLSYLFNNLSMLNDDNKKNLVSLADQMNICGLLYEKINNYYMKLYYRNSGFRVKLQSIQNKFIEIADIENMIYNQLSQLEKKHDSSSNVIQIISKQQ